MAAMAQIRGCLEQGHSALTSVSNQRTRDQKTAKEPEESQNEVTAEDKCWFDAHARQYYTEKEMEMIIKTRYDTLDKNKFVPFSVRKTIQL
jgi:hypothetical protein